MRCHVRKQVGNKYQGASGSLQGKLNTEDLLQSRGLNWTSVRPVYIYGPLNYNPVEEWFFQRLAEGRPIPIPNSGQQVGSVGHTSPTRAADCCLV
jgi:nucleoside-diphosphate-sugar epimerase